MMDMQRLVRSLPRRAMSLHQQAALALVCVTVGAALHFMLESGLAGVPFITFFPAVLVASVWGGTRSGVITLVLGALVAAYFWLEPFRTADLTKLGASTVVVFILMGTIIVLGAHLLHTAVAMARESEARATLIAREMQHRIGNKLAIVQSIVRLSVRHATTLKEFETQFSQRLSALSEAQALAGPDPDLPTDLDSLLRVVLRPFDHDRITISGPPAGIHHRDRPMLALLVHELCTNAVKHGALSRPEGSVAVLWSCARESVRLDWTETGGPPVGEPTRKGFGSDLVRAAFPPDRGSVTFSYDPAGLRCTVTLKAATVAPLGGAGPAASVASAAAQAGG